MSPRALFKMVLVSSLVAVVVVGCSARDDGHDPPTATTERAGQYAALEPLPDWSGTWNTFLGPLETEKALMASLQPAPLAEFRELIRRYARGEINLRELYCAPYLFGGFSEGAEGGIEFLFTPGRVTLVWEGGLVRRIYLDDSGAAQEDPAASNAGISVGHWEGSTLVVQTRLNPNAGPFLGYLNTPGFRVGDGARLTERIFLKDPGKDPDALQMDLTLDAPALLSQPAKLTVLYRRDRHYRMSEYTRCPPRDRSVDDATGRLKHDLAPPADLPPPPG